MTVPFSRGPGVEAPITRQTLLERHEPWLTSDLVDYLGALSWTFGEVELYSYDTDDREGWVIVYDPATCPAQALPYLAQFVGQYLPQGASEIDIRALIADRPHMRRGRPQAIRDAVRPFLVGTQQLLLLERYGGVSDALRVVTYTQETLDQNAVKAALRDVVPADIALTYQVTSEQLWFTVKSNQATWAAVKTKYPTWNGVRSDIVGVGT